MNSLNLSKDQQDRLLEMCVKLFPEYSDFSMFHNGLEYDTDKHFMDFNKHTNNVLHRIE